VIVEQRRERGHGGGRVTVPDRRPPDPRSGPEPERRIR
jgi:hypothetical protein